MTGNIYQLLCLLFCLLLPFRVMAEATVYFLYDEGNIQHQNYVSDSESALFKALPGLKTKRVSLSEVDVLAAAGKGKALVISVGSKAAQLASKSGLPTLNTLITHHYFDSIKGMYRKPVTAIYLDQPFMRMLLLVKKTLPDRRHLAVVLGPTSQQMQPEIKQRCLEQKLHCAVLVVKDQAGIEQAMQVAASRDKVLLVLPDSQVVNATTARNIILGAYRRGVALVGYSRALVKAGALMAVHSTSEQLSNDAALLASDLLQREVLHLPSGRYPERYTVSVNYQLARALRLSIPPESTLVNAIKKSERNE